jgi:LPPG:FO 2-phospho-L-lactate transferase
VTYTLADAIDPARGWGLRDETWRAMDALARFESVRPDQSEAAPRWFNLGDQDLATHFYRTARLREGAPLSVITDEIRRAFDVAVRILPMSNDSVRTRVHLEKETVSFQEYFVQRHHSVPISNVRFDGAEDSIPAPGVLDAIESARHIVIAPSNPLVSIAPVLAVPGIRDALVRRRKDVIAVSPIVAGAALKGPADRMLAELGHDASVLGVAALYNEFAGTLVIDTADETHKSAVESFGLNCIVTETIMSKPGVSESLARTVLSGAPT